MPRIFDNIEQQLLPALRETLLVSDRADFCVGYFNLRGWRQIDEYIERLPGGEGTTCRLLVGMQRMPQEEIRLALGRSDETIDNQTALRLRKRLAQEFREQLTIGIPTEEDEAGLRRLVSQIRARKVTVKLYLRHPLHAKLYLLFRTDPTNPITGYLGSSNLTLAGLMQQGELNVDVLDHDACQKLATWFQERWNDRFCIDISDELLKAIEESWAREEPIPPYHIYVKMAYHLSQEARAGLTEFGIPRDLGPRLFDYQAAAVKIAAHHLNKRGGVVIGDVVGLGKTLMATALARIFEDENGFETLIICPKNLVRMWEEYRDQYRLHARVLSLTQVITELPRLRRYRLVLIDESHNLRNREGRRYRAIQQYIQENESKCILLSATPYNKSYLDVSSQLRLFVAEDRDLGVRPERLLREIGEPEFIRRYQCPIRSLAAFEKSPFADDWRELMRLFLVRRTRSFIQENYAQEDSSGRKFLVLGDGTRSYFPDRVPKTVRFEIDESDPTDQYARLYSDDVVEVINGLTLPRYGLGNYIVPGSKPSNEEEARVLQNLSRAGKRLMGFCRTNLFKRLESSGQAFMQSLTRHLLRNYVFLHAIEQGVPLPIGPQDAGLLDPSISDQDLDDVMQAMSISDGLNDSEDAATFEDTGHSRTESEYRKAAAEAYSEYATTFRSRFQWISPRRFTDRLARDLSRDCDAVAKILEECGEWNPDRDTKLAALYRLITAEHATEKVLVFTQFADTVHYLVEQLKRRGVTKLAGVTGASDDPTVLAWRFSPISNGKSDPVGSDDELRVLITTDVLSEGQNLQDCSVVVNYDLPWAIIRLVQRAGRVDRIGQQSEKIRCLTFLPADGVERIIHLRDRVRRRLRENAEVVGTDEVFFEDEDQENRNLVDLYSERAGILDGEEDSEVDLASYAYQIWKNAVSKDPRLLKIIPEMPPVVYATRQLPTLAATPAGVLVYARTAQGNDVLSMIDQSGHSVTESQYEILRAAECSPDTPSVPRLENHHKLVEKAVDHITGEERTVGGQLGRPAGARFRTYERLKRYAESVRGSLFDTADLRKAIDEIYRFPLRQSAVDTLNRQLRSGITDEQLAQLVIALRDEDRLCVVEENQVTEEVQILCSMGLAPAGEVDS